MTINLKDFTLLIVDDDEGVRSTLYDFFQDEGANVFIAGNGEEALQIALINHIDLILSDIRMPIMDGVELLKSIHESEHNIPLVWLMTGQSDAKEAEVLALGAEGILTKPFKLTDLYDKVIGSLEKRQFETL